MSGLPSETAIPGKVGDRLECAISGLSPLIDSIHILRMNFKRTNVHLRVAQSGRSCSTSLDHVHPPTANPLSYDQLI